MDTHRPLCPACGENNVMDLKVCPRYAAWQKLLGICQKINHVHIKKEFFAKLYFSLQKLQNEKHVHGISLLQKNTVTTAKIIIFQNERLKFLRHEKWL